MPPLQPSEFTPTRTEALARLDGFLPRAGRLYAQERNADPGPGRDNVSVLSPYIRRRLISEREVVDAVIGRHGQQASFKFVQEVFWRTYWKGWLEQHPDVWARYRAELAGWKARCATDTALGDRVRSAVAGETGIDGLDDWAREIVLTGYLHNHARMWFASIWIFTLRLPWELGADFFLRHLLDGDPASNTLSWRWVAGLQTKGKTYLATKDNIARNTGGRFAPEGLASRAIALTEPPLEAPVALPSGDLMPDGAFALLLGIEDLGIESLDLAGVQAVAALAPRRSDDDKTSAIVTAFDDGALCDTLHRAAGLFAGAAIETRPWQGSRQDLGQDPGPDSGQKPSAEMVRGWLRDHRLKTLVMPHAPTGPQADDLADLKRTLRENGVTVRTLLRPWDRDAWPHSGKSFFGLGKQIPMLLAAG